VPFEQSEVFSRHFRQRDIEGNGVPVFVSTPAVQKFDLVSALNEVFQDVVKLVSAVNTVLFLREPILWCTEPEIYGLTTEMAEGAGTL
jgi:hypothetical protein